MPGHGSDHFSSSSFPRRRCALEKSVTQEPLSTCQNARKESYQRSWNSHRVITMLRSR
jgi:hypothetical protein